MKRVLWLFVIVTLCVAVVTLRHTFVHASDGWTQDSPQAIGQEKNLQQIFRTHEQVRLDASEVAAEVRRTGRLSLVTPSMTFDLKLTPHDMRAGNFRAVEIGDDGLERAVESGSVRTYKGKVLGRDDAEARFTIDASLVEGAIITPEERYFIEPLRRYSPTADATSFIFYRGSDVIETPAVGCAVTMAEQLDNATDAVALQESAATPQIVAPAATAATLRQVELATEADFEYVTALGGAAAANSEIMSIMNQVDGVYQRELNLTFKITYQSAWTTAADPYTATDPVGIINEFTNYWNANRTTIHRDLAHMWTGKNVSGRGVSWQGTVCFKPDVSYGLSPRVTVIPQKFIITAHEIGHSFNATHPTDVTCNNTIMSPVSGPSSSLSFCQFSRNEITAFVNAHNSCLTAVTSTCTYSISPASASFASDGGSGRVSVTATAGCSWTAVSNVAWITITADGSGTDNGAVSYTVSANAATTPRTGTLIIAGKTFTVTQAGAPTAPSLSTLKLSPSVVAGCKNVTGTVTLTSPAPANGVVVTLSDNIAATDVPASVTVPVGATSKTFSIPTVPVAANQAGIVTAKLGTVTKSAALTVRRIGVLSLVLTPNPVAGPNPVTGTVMLECVAPEKSDITVALASSNPAVAAPTASSISIPAGSASGKFTARTANVSASSSAIIKATANSITKTKTLTVN